MNTANIGQRPIAREFYDNPATWQISETAYHPPSVAAEENEEWTEQAQYEYDLGVAKAAQAAGFDVILPEPPQTKPHVAYNAGNNEWYTPPEYIAAAIEVMGGIDLDPATTPKANEVVGATRIYTANDDGLFYPWQGRVWMNPPYASELVGKFASKLAQHVQTGDVTDAIVLVNNATETGWFYTLTSVASAVVFPKGRVRFWEPNGAISAPLQGQAVVYIGPRPDLFLNAYRQFGWGATLWQHN
jgi:phage N-6-adenine-methyltransferase